MREIDELYATGTLGDIWPIFKYIPTPGTRKMAQLAEKLYNYMQQILQEHRDSFDPGQSSRVKILTDLPQT